MTVKNTALRQDLVSFKKRNPCYNLSHIGDKFGLTKERVRQILSSEGIDTTLYNPKKMCRQCGDRKEEGQRLYCKKCADDRKYISVRCPQCHRLFRREAYYVIYYNPDHMFCTRNCQSLFVKNSHHKRLFKHHPRSIFVRDLSEGKLTFFRIDYLAENGWASVFDYLAVCCPIIQVSNYSNARAIRCALNDHSIKASVYCVDGKIYIDARIKIAGRLVNNGSN